MDLGVGDLPEEVVRDAHLAGGPDEEVGVGKPGGVEVRGERVLVDRVGGPAPGGDLGGERAGGVGDFCPRTVVEREAEDEPGVGRRRTLGLVELGEDLGGSPSRRPIRRKRMFSRRIVSRSTLRNSQQSAISAATSSAGRFQFSLEKL